MSYEVFRVGPESLDLISVDISYTKMPKVMSATQFDGDRTA
jgi:hypothetical protein